jgi:hypothetical protein
MLFDDQAWSACGRQAWVTRVATADDRWRTRALLGASQATVIPVVQVASAVGVYGLSALVALVGTAARRSP